MDVLRVVHEGAYLPTQIMYRTNLAWVTLQVSLMTLVGTGLLERANVGGKKTYQLTPRGAETLSSFNRVLDAATPADGSLEPALRVVAPP